MRLTERWEVFPDQAAGYYDVGYVDQGTRQRTMVASVPMGYGNSLQTANLIGAAPALLEALEDAEFLLRQLAVNWKEAASMADSAGRSAADAREAIALATTGGLLVRYWITP